MSSPSVEQPLNKVHESLNTINDAFSDLQTKVIDDNLDNLEISNKTSHLMGSLNSLLNINLFGLGTIATLTGISTTKIMETAKKNKILAFVLKKYGGIEGLQKSYIQETLDGFFTDQPEKKSTITTLYTTYQEQKNENICSDIIQDPDSFNIVCGLGIDPTTPATITDHIPHTKFSYVLQTLTDTLDGKEQYLDPNILAQAGCNVPKKVSTDGREIIDIQSPDWNPDLITKDILSHYLIQRTHSFLESSSYVSSLVSEDHMIFALFGGLFVSGNTFPEAVLLGIAAPKDFGGSQENNEISITSLVVEDMTKDRIQQELTAVSSPITFEMVQNSAKKYSVPMSYIMAFMKNDSTYASPNVPNNKGAQTHNPGNVGNMDDGSTKDRGTREAGVDAVAENLKKRIDAYQTKFGETAVPTAAELASGKKVDTGEQFFGVYMTADGGPAAVQNYQEDLQKDIVV